MPTPPRCAVVITALPVERIAVLEHLRDVVEEAPVRGSIYRRGIFDDRSDPWDVIVAEIGAGNEGAAAEAERVLAHYTPEVAVFVGVAGAIKDLSHGDVVASTKVYNYGAGKDRDDHFETRPDTELPGYALLARARHEAGEPHWWDRIRRSGHQSAPTKLPDAAVGPIAAGPKVLASTRTATFEFIRKHYGDAVAVEMEGHGFLLGVRMNHPILGVVIRGISDRIGDKNPDDDLNWQPIAARHAAAFAFQVLAKYSGEAGGGVRSLAARLDSGWQEKHLQDARATAGPRYSPELRVGTPLHDVFEALCTTDLWLGSVRVRGRKLAKLVSHFLGCVKERDENRWGAPFPEHLREAGNTVAGPVGSVGMAFDAILDRSCGGTPAAVAEAATAVLPQVRELHAALRADIENHHGEGTADSASFRQFQAEYQMSFPAANLDAARDLIAALVELETWGRSGPGRAAGAKGILLVGGPGVGKTHGICDIAHERFERGLRTVVLFGEQFTPGDEPWERIRQLLGLGPMGRDEVLAILDATGEASGGNLLLCIDGLNESRPRGYWRNWLGSLAAQVTRYPHIRLCVSCRSTYEQVAVPEGSGLERIEHLGFAGMEFTACREFFAHHGLEPPVAPSFHPEFSNPLFLRLACETMVAAGVRKMPSGWHGLNTALQAFLREKNKAFAQEYERDVRERVPQQALQEFMGEVERTRKVYLRWSDAATVIGRVHPPGLVGPSVLDWLVRTGLLITDMDPEGAGPEAEEVVRVAFERLGDHLFAARLLANVKPGELTTAIESGPLNFAFANPEAVLENQGLVEALSIQVPEHPDFSRELVDGLPPGAPRIAVLRATISALPWRDPEHMSAQTQQIVHEGLTTRGYGREVFDNLLAVATQETGPDAMWLHGSLSRQRMPVRDGFLCGYLHERAGASSAVERLLRAPFEVKSADIPEPVCVRWATLLLWFCIAADRRVRDRATKGLVAITQPRPKLWVTLIEQFASLNDEYVIERCFCAAYGALLRSRDHDAERQVAGAAYEAVFSDSTKIQNALIRDHARCIIELAAQDGVLPQSIDLKTVRPPYRSEWPLSAPSEKEVEQYVEAHREYPKLYMSCLNDDFFTYTLSALEPYEHAIPRKAMGRWILYHIVHCLGYGGNALASYDGYMVYTHGSGRGRPGWAERIGKKYQWIALSRLAARLADNVKAKKESSWEPKVSGVPLVYARGRDIDPSLLAPGHQSPHERAVWWLPVNYDFAAVKGQSNAEWVASSADVPSSEMLLQPIAREDGGEWQILESYPTWSERSRDQDDDSSSSYRRIWTQIRGYLVKRKSADRTFKWMTKQHFMGRWMPEGAEFHEGYVGEYPWGILFTMYPDRWHGRGGGGSKKSPARLVPVCNSVHASYEEDAFQSGGINVHVPARVFFEGEQLRWDGLSGYRDEANRLRFLDPSVRELGSPALLVDRSYLLVFLREHDLAAIWSVLGEKNIIGGHAEKSPRLEFSRAHMLDHTGSFRSSELLIPGG
jgi:nucleoside phosphorylase